MRAFLDRLLPFIFIGIFIVLLIAGLIVVSYLLIYGALIGLVLFLVASIKNAFTQKKTDLTTKPSEQKSGRTFDHDDL